MPNDLPFWGIYENHQIGSGGDCACVPPDYEVSWSEIDLTRTISANECWPKLMSGSRFLLATGGAA